RRPTRWSVRTEKVSAGLKAAGSSFTRPSRLPAGWGAAIQGTLIGTPAVGVIVIAPNSGLGSRWATRTAPGTVGKPPGRTVRRRGDTETEAISPRSPPAARTRNVRVETLWTRMVRATRPFAPNGGIDSVAGSADSSAETALDKSASPAP